MLSPTAWQCKRQLHHRVVCKSQGCTEQGKVPRQSKCSTAIFDFRTVSRCRRCGKAMARGAFGSYAHSHFYVMKPSEAHDNDLKLMTFIEIRLSTESIGAHVCR